MTLKKGLFILATSIVFAILWLLLLNINNLINIFNLKNEGFITFIVFIVASIGIVLISTRKYFSQKYISIINKYGIVALITILSFASMLGIFYLIIIILLSFH